VEASEEELRRVLGLRAEDLSSCTELHHCTLSGDWLEQFGWASIVGADAMCIFRLGCTLICCSESLYRDIEV